MSNRILVVEDDLLLAQSLVDMFEEESYEVVHAPNGQSALDATFEMHFDLYLLDINIPLIDGIDLLKELRGAKDETPAIFLTSHATKEKLAEGFLSGCDDYITKPFDVNELLFRIAALLRRSSQKKVDCIAKLCHDEMHKRIMYDGEELELSKKEYELLLLLMRHADSVVPKEMILNELYTSSQGGSEGAIRVYVNRIKQLIPDVRIDNIRGVGYKLVS